jgi:sulfate transport system permease protein
MAGVIRATSLSAPASAAVTEKPWVRHLLIALAFGVFTVMLILPLLMVLVRAFSAGISVWWSSLTEPDALAALQLTFLVTALVIPLNLIFGLAAAWSLVHFKYRGKSLLTTLIDLPFAVSPVVAGLVYVLLYGSSGWFAPVLEQYNLQVIFALPGIVLATMFVTFPLVARELIPTMQSLGQDQELAALSLGASGWQTFVRITLPRIKWALLYGCILSSARAVGEFGAVSVVSGNIRGLTNTLPLHIEVLYGEFRYTSAFAVASILLLIGLLTLVARHIIDSFSSQTGSKH